MRIAIDYTAAVQQQAGIGRYTRQLVQALSGLDHANRYRLYSAGHDRNPFAWPANFTLRQLPISDHHLTILWQRLRLPLPVELITGPVDLVHATDFVLPPVLHATKVLTIHDLSFLRHPECFAPPLLDYLTRNVPRSVERADMLLADSQSARQDLIELLQVSPERVRVIYPGCEVSQADPIDDPQSVLAHYEIDGPYILALGTLQPRKNFSRLIQAFDLLRQDHHLPHQLVIGGGKGWLDHQIYDTIQQLGLENQVRLIGFVRDVDLPTLYGQASLFAFPSLYEGFGIPVLEAMAQNTPVVTSTTSSLPEVAGDAALLVDPLDVGALAEAMWRLINDTNLRATLIKRGQSQVKRFTWQDSAHKLLQIYTEML